MRVDFNSLPDEALVWVYQSNVDFIEDHLKVIVELSDVFLEQWESHGIKVQGSIDVLSNRFIRVAAYTNEPSMCGRAKDGQARLMKELQEELKIELLNRMLLAFKDGDQVLMTEMSQIEDAVAEGKVQKDTIYYNPLIQNKKEFNEKWEVAAKDTWLERYF